MKNASTRATTKEIKNTSKHKRLIRDRLIGKIRFLWQESAELFSHLESNGPNGW